MEKKFRQVPENPNPHFVQLAKRHEQVKIQIGERELAVAQLSPRDKRRGQLLMDIYHLEQKAAELEQAMRTVSSTQV